VSSDQAILSYKRMMSEYANKPRGGGQTGSSTGAMGPSDTTNQQGK